MRLPERSQSSLKAVIEETGLLGPGNEHSSWNISVPTSMFLWRTDKGEKRGFRDGGISLGSLQLIGCLANRETAV